MKKVFSFITIIFICVLSSCGKINIDDILEQAISETVASNIFITSTSRDGALFYNNTGSGVIFHEDEEYYYFLSCNHVTYLVSGYSDVTYSIMDYDSNYYYDIEVIHMDPNYDLSVGKFIKGNIELEVVEFAENSDYDKEYVIAIGNPNYNFNVVTLGYSYGYTSAPTYNNPNILASNVTFDVLLHNAEISNGSSGGGLYNTDLELIGINYAGITKDGSFYCGYAVGIEEVNTFLDNHFWNSI